MQTVTLKHCLQGIVKPTADKMCSGGVKPPRKSREHRSRSQDWPDVPDVGKIEENNPEILAQKILETGRQIEAGKIRGSVLENARCQPQQRPQPPRPPRPSQPPITFTNNNSNNSNRAQEPPRVANFEDRLKSIITTVLNEDQHNRKQQQNQNQVQPPTTSAPSWHSRPSPVPAPAQVTALHQQQPDYTQVIKYKLISIII